LAKKIEGMRVLFLMFAFPDPSKSFNMYTSLVEEYHKNGHEVFVVAPQFDQKQTALSEENQIPVLRVRTLPLRNVNNYLKGISSLLLPYLYAKGVRKYYKNRNPDVLVIPTPPITLAGLALRLKRKYSCQLYLILKDIFPQNAVDLGFMRKSGFFYKYFRMVEKKLYRASDRIGCMSEGNINYILTNNPFVKRDVLHVLENWQVLNTDYPTKDLSIKATYGLTDKFVVVFGGNMGKPQQLENVLNLAKECERYDKVVFLFLGDGVQRKQLEDQVRVGNYRNVIIKATIPKADFQKLVSVCDIGLISLHADFTIPNIPSKMLDYFNLGIPVLASIDKATDFGKMLEEANAGLWSYAGDLQSFKLNFDKLYANPDFSESLGKNGRLYFEQRLTPDIAYKVMMDNLSKPS
jgi:glycosyltransferase involved in cell wall biosynthesis